MRTLPTALAYVHEVARDGSISAAAQTLHVSASAISRQIGNLERSLGIAVFERHPRGMIPTEAGRLLLAYIRRNAAEGDALFREMRSAQSRRARIITVATVPAFSESLVPRAMAAFAATYPGVAFDMRVLPTADATRSVVEGEADVALAFELGPQQDVRVDFSAPAPVHAAMARDHPLAGCASVGLSEICDYPLVLSSRGTTQRALFDIAVQREALAPQVALEADHISPSLAFVRGSSGITFLAARAMPPEAEDIVLLPLDNPVLGQRSVQIQTMVDRARPPAVTAFIEALARELT